MLLSITLVNGFAQRIRQTEFSRDELGAAQVGGLYVEGVSADSSFLALKHKMLGSDWYLGFMGGISHSLSENATSKDFVHNKPTVEFTLGTTLTRCFGLRINAGISPQMGSADRVAREVWPEKYNNYRFNLLNAYFDGVLYFTNIFSTKYNRPTFDVYGILGFGVVSTYHFDEEKVADWPPYFYVDTKERTYPAAHVGLMTSYRFTQNWDWIIEGTYNTTRDAYNGIRSGTYLDTYVHIKTGLVYHFYNRREQMRLAALNGGKRRGGAAKYFQPLTVKDQRREKKRIQVVEEIPDDAIIYGQPLNTGIRFYLDNYFISPSQSRRMAYIQRFVEAHPEVNLKVTGYGDNENSDMRFMEFLAKSRAIAVRDTLIKKYHVDSTRLTIDWYGEPVQPFKFLENEWVLGVEFVMERNDFKGRPDPDLLVALHDWQHPEEIYGEAARRERADSLERAEKAMKKAIRVRNHGKKAKEKEVRRAIKLSKKVREKRQKEIGFATYEEQAKNVILLPETATLSGDTLKTCIKFYVDHCYLTLQEKLKLQHVAKYLLDHPNLLFQIHTFPDTDEATEEFNLWLSRTRAQSIKDYLVEFQHIQEDRIELKPQILPLNKIEDNVDEWFEGAVFIVK